MLMRLLCNILPFKKKNNFLIKTNKKQASNPKMGYSLKNNPKMVHNLENPEIGLK